MEAIEFWSIILLSDFQVEISSSLVFFSSQSVPGYEEIAKFWNYIPLHAYLT